jgi:hypothetical protein
MQNQQYQQPPPLPKKGISTPIIILIVVLSMCGLCGIIGTIGEIFQKDKPAEVADSNINNAPTSIVTKPTTNAASKPVKTAPEPPKSTAGVTLDNFNKIKTGMTYAQVVEILGEEGQVISENEISGYKTTMYQWKGGYVANMNAMFQNGKLISKAQLGL